jgi:large subunit ribosomal protein L1
MARHGRKYLAAAKQVEPQKLYTLTDAVTQVKKVKFTKFDESVDLSIVLGVDPRHADQMVRGTVNLPHGTGRKKRVLVFAQGEKIKEAEAAGADYVGGADMAQKILDGWIEFEAVVASPDMMREVGKLGKVLGPRGLMPNPKAGTVTPDIAKAIKEIKAGRVEFRVDKQGVVHAPAGRVSFEAGHLAENLHAILGAINRAKPATAKGIYLQAAYVSSTMGPSFKIDPAEARVA